jgi:YbbR domain-containing protein
VKIKIEGKPSPGSEIAEQASVSPQKVQLVGPASSVRGIQYVETDSVVIDGIGVGNHEWTVSAIPIDSVSIRGAESLVVKVQIRWILAERIFHRLKVTVQGNGLEARFKPQEVSVALEGPKLKLEAMSADQIRPVVAVETDKPPALGTFFTGDVTVAWLPDGVKVVSIEPPSVRVSLLAGPSSKPADKKNNKAE